MAHLFGRGPPRVSGFDIMLGLAQAPDPPQKPSPNNTMPTPFLRVVEPDKGGFVFDDSPKISKYDVSLPLDKQDHRVPEGFLDAMKVRTEVFVTEQGVPAENEYDSDDCRSVHFITYASVCTVVQHAVLDENGKIVVPRKSETKSVPIATIRIVPFPAGPHPEKGAHYLAGHKIGADGKPEPVPDHGPLGYDYEDRATSLHDGKEHYVKLGRLAVLKNYRKGGLASLLVNAAQDWLMRHPTYWNRSALEWGLEKLGSKNRVLPKWNGLIGVHSQNTAVARWSRWGFVTDEVMGTWWEEGIEHVGMFKRLQLPSDSTCIDPLFRQSAFGSGMNVIGRRPVQPGLYAGRPVNTQGPIGMEVDQNDWLANLARSDMQKFRQRRLQSQQKQSPDPSNKTKTIPEWCRSTVNDPKTHDHLGEPVTKGVETTTGKETHVAKGLQDLSLVDTKGGDGKDDQETGQDVNTTSEAPITDPSSATQVTPTGNEDDNDDDNDDDDVSSLRVPKENQEVN